MALLFELAKAEQEGFLFHGSPEKIKGELVPFPGYDEAIDRENEKGIFATSNSIVSIWKGVAQQDKQDRPWTTGWSWDNRGDKILYGENIVFKKGYVYILDPDLFRPVEDNNCEHISLLPVKPLQCITVTPNLLLRLQEKIGFEIRLTRKPISYL